MARVLITGASGLIGKEVFLALSASHEVHALLRRRESLPGANIIEQDLSRPLREGALPENVDTVVHLAQSEHFRAFPEAAADIFEVNVGSTFRLLDWARRSGVRRFVFASSGGIYGHGAGPFTEDHPIQPGTEIGFYLSSKSSGEALVESYASCFKVIVLRFFFAYGPGQRETMLVPRLVRSVMEGRPITLQGSEGLRMNPVYVSDAAACVNAACSLEESHKINVAGDEVTSLRALGETIGAVVGRAPVFTMQQGQEPRHLVADVQKMRRLLVSPKVGLRQGIENLFNSNFKGAGARK